MASSDAVVTQASAAALALPDRGDDAEVDPALSVGMEASDPATRASSARAVVVREASGLSLAVQGVFSQGQDRVMNDVLQGLVDSGNPVWQPLVAQGLAAELPTIRELAVDAAVASCREEDRELMEEAWTLTTAHREDLAGRPGNPQEEALVVQNRPSVMDMLHGRE